MPSAYYGPGVLLNASRITAQRNCHFCGSNFYIIHPNTLAPIALTTSTMPLSLPIFAGARQGTRRTQVQARGR